VFHPDVTRVVAGAVERAGRAAAGGHGPAEGARGPVHDIAGHDVGRVVPGHEAGRADAGGAADGAEVHAGWHLAR
jgi:hypothetical protein